MDLQFKPDWDDTKKRFACWWNRENFGRCALSVRAPLAGAENSQPPPLPERVEDRWLDLDYVSRLNDYRMSATYYGGEALPVWNMGYPGCDSIPAFLGCEVDLQEETGWVHPCMDKGALTDYEPGGIKLDKDSRWFRFALEVHRMGAAQARGKSLPGIQAIGSVGDVLAWLRGTERLLEDMIDCPDYVRMLELHLMDIWKEVFGTLYDITKHGAEGATNFMSLWAPGRFYIAANDFAYMISPKMYEEVFLDALLKNVGCLDYCLYHVDGEGCFNHVDLLCSVDGINGLQILPGAGKPSPLHYMDVLQKVQRAGKNLHITIPPGEVEGALSALSSKGLFIETVCDTEQDARDLLACAEKWSVWR